jgi:hypothetical protein
MPCLPLSRIAPRRRLMAMTGVLALAVTTAAEASKPPRPPEPEMFDLDPVLRSEVRVTEDFRAKPASGGLFKLLKAGDRLVIHKGVFTPSMGLRADGREWLLIPYVLRSQGQARSPNSSMSPVSGCFSRFTRLLALDRQTLQVEPWVWKIHDHRCDTVAPTREGEWSEPIAIETGAFQITGFTSHAEAEAARQAEDRLQFEAAHQRVMHEQAMLPKKREIGARLCQLRGSYRYMGFTEAVSPDNAKVQIRVSGAVSVDPDVPQPRSFTEHIVWDDPNRWSLCE